MWHEDPNYLHLCVLRSRDALSPVLEHEYEIVRRETVEQAAQGDQTST